MRRALTIDRTPPTETKQTDSKDVYGWPGPDFHTEIELTIMYGVLVEARRQREREIAQADMPERPKMI